MLLYRATELVEKSFKQPVITIGNFDGVHRGHQEIIKLAIKKARLRAGTSIAFTFRPHPQRALRPDRKLQLLTTYDEKIKIFEELGVDVCVEEPFSRDFSTLSPEQFFNEFLLKRLHAEAIVVGYDFAFGKEREGSLDKLKGWCESTQVELTVVPPFKADGEVISSSRLRAALNNGSIHAANQLMGRPFFYQGVVVKGDQRGREIGFRTANFRVEEKLLLPFGVYATRCRVGQNNFESVTNIGSRPTFVEAENAAPIVETHILNQDLDLYGQTVEVSFFEKIREEKKFDGINGLVSQIRQDIATAQDFFKNEKET